MTTVLISSSMDKHCGIFFPKAVDKHSETKGVISDVSFSPFQTPFDVFSSFVSTVANA